MTDYRQPENRREYFSKLYRMNLEYGVMPGLVYLYMPALADRFKWEAEEQLWFAFLNGLTQNPITSLRLFERLPGVPPADATLAGFEAWFNENWDSLQFDTDRRYQKKDTVAAIKAYAGLVSNYGPQRVMLTNPDYRNLWQFVREGYLTFGRLSTFSYLEYVRLNGFGVDCDDLLFHDKSGSRSHRNGMLFLMGKDELVWDKRIENGCIGEYANFKPMCVWLAGQASQFLTKFEAENPGVRDVGNFTLESNLCTFKNHFFGRRYPGVYADMAWERIQWADERGLQAHTEVFKEIRAGLLPEWLRMECEPKGAPGLKTRGAMFPDTGVPFRGGYFL